MNRTTCSQCGEFEAATLLGLSICVRCAGLLHETTDCKCGQPTRRAVFVHTKERCFMTPEGSMVDGKPAGVHGNGADS